ncbi:MULTISPECIES: GreA/GreB family elongation factor [Saccharopolyspora]|jgi:transcription elongation factor GreA|uniref:Transcription elongation factor GreAB n=2 Tax=Saccharopolyspora TaxID=1835 RepID=A0A4V2YW76_9PSEU|nr:MULTISPECIES: GreA/GreB family elongation factor [Saccharopolyspora]MBQ0923438.1 GreA/GreB family elongation factor [Saccharopolyspora endophytica]TDD84337.1 transcription elongation factor GreAB [Saccharopolyspora karakumensis]
MTTTQPHWMTQDAHDRLRAELAELVSHRSAAELDDEGHRRARIRQIRDLLDNAVVGDPPPDDGVAEPGMQLTVRYDDGEIETFLLGTRDGTDTDGLAVYSPESPLGAALTGARQGDERTYDVPNGGTERVTLLKAVPHRP